MKDEYVVLVDELDNELGTMEKMSAHRQAALHRAISIFLFNSKGELLLQQRAQDKYHSGGLWTNTCCSHPRWKEEVKSAAVRRLKEEMGMQTELQYLSQIIYKAELNNGLHESELDHVFIGFSDELPLINPVEVADYKYMGIAEVEEWMKKEPGQFTEWFKILFKKVVTEARWKKLL
jgi:isopentenyl-diphosphate Delta-isomerase